MEDMEEWKHPQRRTGLTKLFRLMGIGGIIMLAAAIVFPYFISYGGLDHRRPCDRYAIADLSKLGTAVERFGNELVDLNCDYDAVMSGFSEEHIGFMTGKWYGWAGTSRYCHVRIRMKEREIQACAIKGSRPDKNDPEVRYIYRVALSGGTDLPVTKGPCTGKTYGGPEDVCYQSSMVGKDCALQKPKVAVKCEGRRGKARGR